MQAPVGRYVEKKSFLDAPVAFAQGSPPGDPELADRRGIRQ
jgi:hypothetical protein